MTHEELIKEVKQLSVEERIAVRDAIAESLKEEAEPREAGGSIVDQLYGIAKPDGQMP